MALLSWGIVPVAIAQSDSSTKTVLNQADASANHQSLPSLHGSNTNATPRQPPILDIPRLAEIEHTYTSAELLVQESTPFESTPSQTTPTQTSPPGTNQADEEVDPDFPTNETDPFFTEEQDEIEITVTGEREIFPEMSTPVYTITEEEIQKQGASSAAEVLRGLPDLPSMMSVLEPIFTQVPIIVDTPLISLYSY